MNFIAVGITVISASPPAGSLPETGEAGMCSSDVYLTRSLGTLALELIRAHPRITHAGACWMRLEPDSETNRSDSETRVLKLGF